MEGGGLTPPSAIPKVEPRWEEPGEAPPEAVQSLQVALSLPEVLCALLVKRDLADPGRAKAFLRPLLSELDVPDSLAGMVPATERVLDAVRTGETILVHGDYDVDGIAGATLLARWIRRIGGNAIPFVPHRLRDGYDLGAAGIGAAREAGADLILTVDSGIRAHDAVADANAAGLDVIITDHHTPAETLPPALAVVNPNRVDCGYANKGLCGTGVAYRLCEALVKEKGIDPEELYSSLDLVALATIADVVPLNQENRTLVRYGLKALAQTKLPGLRALMARAGLGDGPIDAGQVAFRIAPRINAAGRMAEAMTALELLMSDDVAHTSALADRLEDANDLRREEENADVARGPRPTGAVLRPRQGFRRRARERRLAPGGDRHRRLKDRGADPSPDGAGRRCRRAGARQRTVDSRVRSLRRAPCLPGASGSLRRAPSGGRHGYRGGSRRGLPGHVQCRGPKGPPRGAATPRPQAPTRAPSCRRDPAPRAHALLPRAVRRR